LDGADDADDGVNDKDDEDGSAYVNEKVNVDVDNVDG